MGTFEDEFRRNLLPLVVLFITCNVVGLFGNILVQVVYGTRYPKNHFRILVLALSAVDFMSCCSTVPMETVSVWYWVSAPSAALCKAKNFFVQFIGLSAMYMLFITAVYKHRMICMPFKKALKTKTIIFMCLTGICMSFLIAIPAAILWDRNRHVFNSTDHVINGPNIANRTETLFLCEVKPKYHQTNWPMWYRNIISIYDIFLLATIVLYFLVAKHTINHVRKIKKQLRQTRIEVKFDFNNLETVAEKSSQHNGTGKSLKIVSRQKTCFISSEPLEIKSLKLSSSPSGHENASFVADDNDNISEKTLRETNSEQTEAGFIQESNSPHSGLEKLNFVEGDGNVSDTTVKETIAKSSYNTNARPLDRELTKKSNCSQSRCNFDEDNCFNPSRTLIRTIMKNALENKDSGPLEGDLMEKMNVTPDANCEECKKNVLNTTVEEMTVKAAISNNSEPSERGAALETLTPQIGCARTEFDNVEANMGNSPYTIAKEAVHNTLENTNALIPSPAFCQIKAGDTRLSSDSTRATDERHSQNVGHETNRLSNNQNGSRQHINVRKVKMMVIIAGTFAVTFLMALTFGYVFALFTIDDFKNSAGEFALLFFCYRLYFVNYALNPVIYYIYDKQFRHEVNKLLCRRS